jgi:hypothetical protein
VAIKIINPLVAQQVDAVENSTLGILGRNGCSRINPTRSAGTILPGKHGRQQTWTVKYSCNARIRFRQRSGPGAQTLRARYTLGLHSTNSAVSRRVRSLTPSKLSSSKIGLSARTAYSDRVSISTVRIKGKNAQIVRRIFAMAADGASLKTIAKTLNREKVLSPRPRARKRYATWCPSAIREMLQRELYIGRVVWNKSRFIKKPNTNTRVRRPRPISEWRINERPELRIVEESLWDRVQQRLAWIAEKYNYANQPGLLHRAVTSPMLLTGFIKCGICGANLTIVNGRSKGRHPRYGCPQNYNRGAVLKQPKGTSQCYLKNA